MWVEVWRCEVVLDDTGRGRCEPLFVSRGVRIVFEGCRWSCWLLSACVESKCCCNGQFGGYAARTCDLDWSLCDESFEADGSIRGRVQVEQKSTKVM